MLRQEGTGGGGYVGPSVPAPDSPPAPIQSPKRSRVRLYLLVASVVLVAVVVFAGTIGGQKPQTSDSHVLGQKAYSDLASAASMVPSPYVQGTQANGTCSTTGCLSSASGTFGRPENSGSTGVSVRISVFNSSASAGAGYAAAVGVVKAKVGYTDISSTLGQYAAEGSCFGAGVGTLTGSTVTVYCTKDNVLFNVNFDSTLALDGLQAEMPGVLAAVYTGIA